MTSLAICCQIRNAHWRHEYSCIWKCTAYFLHSFPLMAVDKLLESVKSLRIAVRYKLSHFFWTTVYIYTYSYPLCSEWVGHTSSEWGTRCRWTSDARPLKWTVVTTQSKCDSNWWSEMEKEDAGDLTKVPLTIIANNGKSWHPLFHAIDCRRQLFDGLI